MRALRSSALRGAYALGLLVLISGCVWTVKRPTVDVPPPEEPPPPLVTPPPAPPAPPPIPSSAVETPPTPNVAPPTPNIEVEESKGVTPEEANALFAPAKEALAGCGSAGGMLRVRVTSEGARTVFKIDPS